MARQSAQLTNGKRLTFALSFSVLAWAPQWRRKQEPKTRGFEPAEETRTRAAKTAKTVKTPVNPFDFSPLRASGKG